ncbi:alpha-amylase family glycosyl hydrolase [Salidesulfovibrio onnuriiensis]|uniref:alpha-amylase family glycosyl hydrolase n=1 Tax=Salidesulfovibrio onnuriiensis TaxID=2583823 RepID=UPI0011CB9AE0|nr:alpha-amylase family glycosyl hydrolase [Salidesulfovibrio onnuriiensis]
MSDASWWKQAVFYQIYPRSFYDADNDGVGDLRGIIEKLDYLNDGRGGGLGIDAIWISPFFPSPMADFGYDVSDYTAIHPIFGSLDDFDVLVSEAHARGIRVMIDLVFNHSSDQHPWFRESRRSRGNPKADWYVWADPGDDGEPPNNWLSVFGGSAWAYEPARDQYYLHSFLKEMPDLNWYSAKVREALAGVVRFWMDRGVDGFRFDAVDHYAYDRRLRPEPPRDYELAALGDSEKTNPWCGHARIYCSDRPENIENLEFLRSVLDEKDGVVSLGEVGIVRDLESYIRKAASYCRQPDRLHMAYTFAMLTRTPSPKWFAEIVRLMEEGGNSWPCWSLGNHDSTRLASRYPGCGELYRTLQLVLLCMRGTPVLYYGDELDMEQAELAFEEIRDPFGKAFWPDYKGRDGCRTPFPWDGTARNMGFNSGTEPWLPMRGASSLDRSQADPMSTLHLLRAMIRLRREHPALSVGAYEELRQDDSVWAFARILKDERLFVAANFSAEACSFPLPEEYRWLEQIRLEAFGDKNGAAQGGAVQLPGYGFYIGLNEKP